MITDTGRQDVMIHAARAIEDSPQITELKRRSRRGRLAADYPTTKSPPIAIRCLLTARRRDQLRQPATNSPIPANTIVEGSGTSTNCPALYLSPIAWLLFT